jgi:hypothetical protein
MSNSSSRKYLLHTQRIKGIPSEEFDNLVASCGIGLTHASWQTAQVAARQLSELGGVASVSLVMVRTKTTIQGVWKDGVQTENLEKQKRRSRNVRNARTTTTR